MKNRILKVLAAIGCVSILGLLVAAGTVSQLNIWGGTERPGDTILPRRDPLSPVPDSVSRLDLTVVTNAAGAASQQITLSSGRAMRFGGEILGFETSATVPCGDYFDVAVRNDRGSDVLKGLGADQRSTIVNTIGMTLQPSILIGTATVEVSSATAACTIYLTLYWR
jgi:hypothetical protein